MGGDIASWCAIQGYSVTVQDQSPERLAQTIKRAQSSYIKKFKRDRRAIRDANDRLLANLRISVTNNLGSIRVALKQVLPGSDIKLESVGNAVMMSGVVRSANANASMVATNA